MLLRAAALDPLEAARRASCEHLRPTFPKASQLTPVHEVRVYKKLRGKGKGEGKNAITIILFKESTASTQLNCPRNSLLTLQELRSLVEECWCSKQKGGYLCPFVFSRLFIFAPNLIAEAA